MLVISWITVQSVSLFTEQCRTAHNKVIKTSHNEGGYEGEREIVVRVSYVLSRNGKSQ